MVHAGRKGMKATGWIPDVIGRVAGHLHTCNRCHLRRRSRRGEYVLPHRRDVHDVLDSLVGVLFPGCHGHGSVTEGRVGTALQRRLTKSVRSLLKQVTTAFEYECETDPCSDCGKCTERASVAVRHLVESLPGIQTVLQEDIEAAYEGDPAAKSVMEVVMSYPAIQAIVTHRIAHLLYAKGVPLIPRIMSELAHSRTGIDIHPGAQIGRGFFIDHGTGVVIGETTVIGDHVKIYQGVTLGALSFPKDKNGRPIKGIKRHPNVEDSVTIYAGATILGGDTVIGRGSEIGGNVWLVHSVPPFSKVYNKQPKYVIRERR